MPWIIRLRGTQLAEKRTVGQNNDRFICRRKPTSCSSFIVRLNGDTWVSAADLYYQLLCYESFDTPQCSSSSSWPLRKCFSIFIFYFFLFIYLPIQIPSYLSLNNVSANYVLHKAVVNNEPFSKKCK